MRINCAGCGIYLGEILAGSKIKKRIKYLCPNCYERLSLADSMIKTVMPKGKSKEDLPSAFKDLFGFGR